MELVDLSLGNDSPVLSNYRVYNDVRFGGMQVCGCGCGGLLGNESPVLSTYHVYNDVRLGGMQVCGAGVVWTCR